MDAPPVTESPPKSKPGTTPFTWACTVAVILAVAGGGSWWYFTRGPGRTVDTTGVQEGMSRLEVCKLLGDPDDIVAINGETAMRYGRTHVWMRGAPGRGDMVIKVTVGPQ